MIAATEAEVQEELDNLTAQLDDRSVQIPEYRSKILRERQKRCRDALSGKNTKRVREMEAAAASAASATPKKKRHT